MPQSQPPENTATDKVSALSGKVVPRSEAILSHGSPDSVRQRREDLQEKDLDKRVHAPSAHELGIAKGMLVQVVAKVRVPHDVVIVVNVVVVVVVG